MAKVLQNGKQLAILVGLPKWVTSEKVLKSQMGGSWSADNVRVQARAQQITHYTNKVHPGRDNFVCGDTQLVDLPFKRVPGAGDVSVNWNYFAENNDTITGKKYKHQQFTLIMSVTVVSADNYEKDFEDKGKAAALNSRRLAFFHTQQIIIFKIHKQLFKLNFT
jgi:hypothetical protein